MDARCLSMHAQYRCRHSGVCCTMGWAIPVEPELARALSAHFGNRRGQLFAPGDVRLAGNEPRRLAVRPGPACACFDAAAGRTCAIHRELGEDRLPVPCRHFPRIVLRDARGLSVTLSHVCPTVAATLFDTAPLAIVPAPDAITLHGRAEGLDATGVLPPLLRPGMLMDLDACRSWEDHAVAALADDTVPPLDALSHVAGATARLATWSPGGTSLAAAVPAAFAGASPARRSPDPDVADDLRSLALAIASVPEGLERPAPLDAPASSDADPRWRAVRAVWHEQSNAVRRYLAARLFGSWYAYEGAGISTVVRQAALAGAVLRCEIARRVASPVAATRDLLVEAVGAADLLLVHQAHHPALARRIDTEFPEGLLR